MTRAGVREAGLWAGLWAALAVLAALPVALVRVPQLADLPNHIARHHILAEAGHNPAIDRWWSVGWRWIGNLGVDLPVLWLTRWTDVETATRIVVLLIAPLTVLGLLALGRAAHGRLTPGVALALPFAFSQPWHYGFVNSCLGVALALLAAAAWIARPPRGWLAATGYGGVAVIVWTAHVMGWGVLLLLVAGAEVGRAGSLGELRARVRFAAPLLVPLLPILVWRASAGGAAFSFSPDIVHAKLMNVATMLKGLSQPFDLAMTAVVGALALVALAGAARPWVEERLAIGAALLVLAAAVMPTTLLGSWGADLRLTPVAAMVALASIAPARSAQAGRWLVLAGIAVFGLRAAATTGLWLHRQGETEARLAILADVPAGAHFGFVAVARDCREPWALTIDRKLGSYAVTRRDAFANTLFLIPGADLIGRRVASDAARWFDGSQDVAAICPEGRVDAPAADARVHALARDGFDAIWLAGVAPSSLPPGFRIAGRRGDDFLLLRGAREPPTVRRTAQ